MMSIIRVRDAALTPAAQLFLETLRGQMRKMLSRRANLKQATTTRIRSHRANAINRPMTQARPDADHPSRFTPRPLDGVILRGPSELPRLRVLVTSYS
jgi:hypothetical protein